MIDADDYLDDAQIFWSKSLKSVFAISLFFRQDSHRRFYSISMNFDQVIDQKLPLLLLTQIYHSLSIILHFLWLYLIQHSNSFPTPFYGNQSPLQRLHNFSLSSESTSNTRPITIPESRPSSPISLFFALNSFISLAFFRAIIRVSDFSIKEDRSKLSDELCLKSVLIVKGSSFICDGGNFSELI